MLFPSVIQSTSIHLLHLHLEQGVHLSIVFSNAVPLFVFLAFVAIAILSEGCLRVCSRTKRRGEGERSGGNLDKYQEGIKDELSKLRLKWKKYGGGEEEEDDEEEVRIGVGNNVE